MSELPVAAILDQALEALRKGGRLVLTAPPGAGKTTLVPLALAQGGWGQRGQVWVLQPRRVAARAMAARVAGMLGEPVGRRVGHLVRFERRVSDLTRLVFVTEGVLTRRLLQDPELTGISAVVLDELHERSLHLDLALAMVREVQEVVRPDLALCAMSATLDAEKLGAWLACPVLTCQGRQHPLEVATVDTPDPRPLPQRVLDGIERLIDDEPGGDVLVFLAGAGEVDACAAAAAAALAQRGWDLARLHGSLPPAAQDAALTPGPRPRVVLATNLAETSLTIGGVRAVLDTGYHKELSADPASGLDRLWRVRISRASADQRAGRAGRLGPGRVLRLWSRAEHAALSEYTRPEIARVDLAELVLAVKGWGAPDPRRFGFFEAPPEAALDQAERLLALLGATRRRGTTLTDVGRALLGIPAHPRVGRVLYASARAGRLRAASRALAELVEGRRGATSETAEQLVRAARAVCGDLPPEVEGELGRDLLQGWPDRLCRRRAPGSTEVVLGGGRGARLSRACAGEGGELLLALEVRAERPGEPAVVHRTAPVDPAWLAGDPRYGEEDELRWDEARHRVVAERVTRWVDLELGRRPVPLQDRARAAELLLARASPDPEDALRPGEDARHLMARLVTLVRGCPELALPDDPRGWLARVLPDLCLGASGFDDLRARDLSAALRQSLPPRVRLDALVPAHFVLPSGRRAAITYALDGPPILAVKLQELLGVDRTPTVAGRPLCLHLLSPAGRAVQITSDLPRFWRESYPLVRAEMRGRYPKHRWPEDPLSVAGVKR